jgi:hypothetical protein
MEPGSPSPRTDPGTTTSGSSISRLELKQLTSDPAQDYMPQDTGGDGIVFVSTALPERQASFASRRAAKVSRARGEIEGPFPPRR